MPKVSVIVPTYNCEKYLPEAIESVLAQTYQDFEIVIVDDGSTDKTREILTQYILDAPAKIKYIYQENKGLAIARNTAIKNASGKYIAILDADDKWLPNRLKEGVAILEKNPSVGLVHANISWLAEDGQQISTPHRNKKYLSGRIFNHIFVRNANISISTILLRKECFDRVGLFDENLARLGCEDREMWLRVAQVFEFFYIDKVLGFYRIRQGSMSKNRAKMMEARYYVVDKFCPSGKNFILRRRGLSEIYRESGDDFLREGDFFSAKAEYLKSIRFWPLHFWSMVNFLKAAFKKKTTGEKYYQ